MNHRSFCAFALCFLTFSVHGAPAKFQFRQPHLRGYVLEAKPSSSAQADTREQWLRGHPEQDLSKTVEFGRRLLVRIQPGKNVKTLVANSALHLIKTVNETAFIFEAPDALTALHEADRLSQSPDVLVCAPLMRNPIELHSTYAPNDPFLNRQWNLTDNTNSTPSGADLNIRNAWQIARGNGVVIGFGDDGVELTHPELSGRAAGILHYNFIHNTTNGQPVSSVVSTDQRQVFAHGTAVAGMAVAEGNNSIGIVGAAPESKLASWVIFTTNLAGIQVPAEGEQLMSMFQHDIHSVAIQNHSWGNERTPAQFGIDAWAELGIENAIENGRGGRGVVMVRSVGNYRYWRNTTDRPGETILANANDDGYPSDRRVIGVAAVNARGRVTRYSNPGACILVAAPATEWIASDDNFPDLTMPALFMLDRQGALGYNTADDALSSYTFSNNLVIGTSFAAPQVAGLAALMLSVNTNLTYRDVQQIMILSARHFDFADPDLTTNGAGLAVSHNVGFGIPDAAAAVNLARTWSPRPPLLSVSFTNDNPVSVIDDGLRLVISNAPPDLQTISGSPGTGVHADAPTGMLPLVDVGFAAEVPVADLTGKAALIQRGGGATFAAKIANVAQAGAAFAIIFNDRGTTERLTNPVHPGLSLPMTDTDFSPIPAIFINKQQGDALRNFVATNSETQAEINLLATNYTFIVTNNFVCEHIVVEVDGDNIASPDNRRGDIRITLTSPSGTRSVLQRLNTDTNRLTSPAWAYQSTHHFFEGSAGAWTVAISDEAPGATATIRSVVLRVFGTEKSNGNHHADFDGNAHPDLILQNADRRLAAWLTDGTNVVSGAMLRNGLPLPAGWNVAGMADFNHDDKPDLLLQHSNSKLAIWFMNGTSYQSSQWVRNGIGAGTGWKGVAAADFNGDARPDILFQHASNGKMAVWFQNGSTLLGSALLRNGAPLVGWKVAGTGDFNRDGYNDILLQHDNRRLAIWYLKNTNYLGADLLRNGLPAAVGWRALAVADLSLDGKNDIVFQHTKGQVAVWYMDGKNFLGSALLKQGKTAAPWRLIGPK